MATSAATTSRAFIAEAAKLVDQAAKLSGWDPTERSLEPAWQFLSTCLRRCECPAESPGFISALIRVNPAGMRLMADASAPLVDLAVAVVGHRAGMEGFRWGIGSAPSARAYLGHPVLVYGSLPEMQVSRSVYQGCEAVTGGRALPDFLDGVVEDVTMVKRAVPSDEAPYDLTVDAANLQVDIAESVRASSQDVERLAAAIERATGRQTYTSGRMSICAVNAAADLAQVDAVVRRWLDGRAT